VPDLEFITTLLADTPVLDVDLRYYQRLLAGDRSEALDLLEEHSRDQPETNLYDALMLPALNYAVRDRLDDRLEHDDERTVLDATRELLPEAAVLVEPRRASSAATPARPTAPLRVLGCAVDGEPDALALAMLAQLLDPTQCVIEGVSGARLASEVIERAKQGDYRVVCIAYLPPSPGSRALRLVKRLHPALPDVKILVGAWAPEEFGDEDLKAFEAAGADHAARRLVDTADTLAQIAHDVAVRSTPAGAA